MDKVTVVLICALLSGCTAEGDESRDIERSTKSAKIERIGVSNVYRVDDSSRGVTCYLITNTGISCVMNRWSGNP